jgi:hypothetical protein
MSVKLDVLKAATGFIYSEKGPDYGDLGGCGDTVKILMAIAEELALAGVELKYGYAHFPMKGVPGGDPNAHAWLKVDGEIFDPSQLAHGFRVTRYDAWTPARAEEFQSDLLECIVGFNEREITEWKERTLEALMRGGLPGLEYDLPDVARLFFISHSAPHALKKFAVDLIWYLYSPDKGGQVDEYGMWDSGGCWTLAQALHDWLGPKTSLHWVVGWDPKKGYGPSPQHVVLKIGNFYVDGNGVYTANELLEWWRDIELYKKLSMRPFDSEEAGGLSIHCKSVMREQLVADFEKYLEKQK